VRKYITCEAQLDLPGLNADRVADQVRRMYADNQPIKAWQLAMIYDISTGAIEGLLQSAERAGLVKHVIGDGWIPLTASDSSPTT
jgi:hypothetical protein